MATAQVIHSTAFARLFDDASQFPPGNLPLEAAWQAHRRWRAGKRAPFVGRLLVPSARAPELAALMGDAKAELGVVVAPDHDPAVLVQLRNVTSIELRSGVDELGGWRGRTPGALIFLEGVPVAEVAAARERDERVGAKLRCGGLEASAFPSAGTVAAYVADCVRLDVPFKATAGLHQPLRHWDPEIGVHHHGFLNLWAATALAAAGAKQDELVRCVLSDELDLGGLDLVRARRWFTAFGTCSIDEPLAGLAALGLLDG